MTQRADVVRMLEMYGFFSCGGTRHERFRHPDGRQACLPRHGEAPDLMVAEILREAGLRG